ncbi:hypothetical protein Tco_0144315 [Tanacetum coccineum]
MSNTNLQTQTSNVLHNAIMEAGGKDRRPMLAPGNYNPPYKLKWTEKTVPVAEGSSETTIEGYMENYKNVSQDIQDQLNAEAEAVQIILTGIDNNIYSTVDACPNACEMWKSIERLKQDESINVQDLETNLYWEFGKFTSRDGESLESYYSRFYKMMNELSQELKTVSYHKLYDILKQHQNEVNEIRAERLARTANPLALVAQQQPVYHPQNHPTHNNQYSTSRSQQSTRNRGKEIVNSSAPIYDQGPATVTEDNEMSKEKEIDKLMALISLSFKKIYKPTNNNLRTSSNTSRANQDNSPRINRGTGYDNQRVVNVVGARENVDPVDNFRPIFDAEPLHKVQNNTDNYNVFAIENEHPKQPESVNDIYLEEQNDTNITIDSLDICYDRDQDDQDDTDELDQECDLNMDTELRLYFNSLEHEVDTLKSQLETQKTQFLNEMDRLLREYYYADHLHAILGVYTYLDEVTNLQCDYLETLEKCEHLEKELSKSRTMSKSFEALQKHAINLELDL